jgi:predicted RNA-binding Zn-ribbon protein involved in translation (DUF1610 family)
MALEYRATCPLIRPERYEYECPKCGGTRIVECDDEPDYHDDETAYSMCKDCGFTWI